MGIFVYLLLYVIVIIMGHDVAAAATNCIIV